MWLIAEYKPVGYFHSKLVCYCNGCETLFLQLLLPFVQLY